MDGERHVSTRIAIAVLTSVLIAGCSSGGSSSAGSGESGVLPSPPVSSSTPTGAPADIEQSAAPTTSESAPAEPALPAVQDPVSLPALMRADVVGKDLRLGKVLARTSAYTRYAVSYSADALTITGIMNVPVGAGPFPVVVLLHGHIDEDVYVTGQGYRREQDSLARNGFVAFHVDYRNHAGSDDDPTNDENLRLGYARDTIAAVAAVKESTLGFLDADRVGIIGRSMGGGVAYNALVARPDLVDAAVMYASVSTDAVDNYNRWIRFDDGRRQLVASIDAVHGSPESNPVFWEGISARTYLDRIETPLLIHHGVRDDTCPIAWTRATVSALRAAEVDLTYFEYADEGHYFNAGWALSMRRTLAFLRENLRA